MVTGHKPERRRLAEVALRCFLSQTYRRTELLIISTGEEFKAAPNIHVLYASHARTLGELRNLGIENARGEYVIQWDDDDWHHPERISEQMKLAGDSHTCCVLSSQLRYNLLSTLSGERVYRRGIDGTILHAQSTPYRYVSVRKGEDAKFFSQFRVKRILRTRSELYVRLYHGTNTWDAHHIMKSLLPITTEHRRFLETHVLPDYLPSPN